MVKFNSKESALDYAKNNISAEEYEVVEINGIKTFLAGSWAPIEWQLKERFEEILVDLVNLCGESAETHSGEISATAERIQCALLKYCETLIGVNAIAPAGGDENE